ncbi:MAG: GNAT family N-acetyltransferase [Oscillospiraceae bacterium]|nr:GNAT family N-acetyltransferase [Oscillospiraceae bacterium]
MVYEGTLEGFGVRLRSLEEGDAAFLFKLRTDRERTRFVHAIEGTVDDQRLYIQKQRAREGDYYFLAEDLNGEPFGALAYYNLVDKNGETGRMVLNGTFAQNCDAILQLRRFAFEIIGAEYVRCTVVNGNKPVLAQIKRMGGEQVGSFIDSADGSEVLEFHVSRETYEERKEKYRQLVEKSYRMEQR